MSEIFSPIFIDKNKIFLDHLINENDGSYFELKERYLCKTDTNQAKELVQTGYRTKSKTNKKEIFFFIF